MTIEEELGDLHYWPIRPIDYDSYFNRIQFNGKNPSESERMGMVKFIDKTIKEFSAGLPMCYNGLERLRDIHDPLYERERSIRQTSLFVLIAMLDCMVACKYFLLADTDYDKRFMRGKLQVILNEGFKKLYGFTEACVKKSEWARLAPLMSSFPPIIRKQYECITTRLAEYSKRLSWWKDQRDYETHFDTERLYLSRQEDVVEGIVVIDSLVLYQVLECVNLFLSNAHAYTTNVLIDMYKRGELK